MEGSKRPPSLFLFIILCKFLLASSYCMLGRVEVIMWPRWRDLEEGWHRQRHLCVQPSRSSVDRASSSFSRRWIVDAPHRLNEKKIHASTTTLFPRFSKNAQCTDTLSMLLGLFGPFTMTGSFIFLFVIHTINH